MSHHGSCLQVEDVVLGAELLSEEAVDAAA